MREPDRSTQRGVVALAVLATSLVACTGPKVGSVGAVLSVNRARDTLVVREVPAGLSGAQGGLREGDVILTVDGQDVRGLDDKGLTTLLRGEIGTEVALTVERKGEIERLRIVRGPFQPGKKR